jgi:hypothetical protein
MRQRTSQRDDAGLCVAAESLAITGAIPAPAKGEGDQLSGVASRRMTI